MGRGLNSEFALFGIAIEIGPGAATYRDSLRHGDAKML